MKRVIDQSSATTVRELINNLMDMVDTAPVKPETIYVTINSDSIKLVLIEETLTDGSLVYNIELHENAPN